ncbi:hypothetical protein [Saccharopolyspora sp. 5N708]
MYFACIHVSQRNTFTGKLAPAMLRGVLEHAKELADVECALPRSELR